MKAITLTLGIGIGLPCNAENLPIEQRLNLLNRKLKRTTEQLQSHHILSKKVNAPPLNRLSLKVFERGEVLFSEGSLTGAENHFRFFLKNNQSSKQQIKRQHALFYLAQIAFKQNLYSKADRLLFQYVGRFVANEQKDFDQLYSMLSRIFLLATKKQFNRAKITQLVHSLSLLSFPDDRKKQFEFLQSQLIYHFGDQHNAVRQMKKLAKTYNDPILKAEVLYYQSLFHYTKGDLTHAKKALFEVSYKGLTGNKGKLISDKIRMQKARLEYLLDNVDTAVDIYAEIQPESHYYSNALYEKLYCNFQRRQFKAAFEGIEELVRIDPEFHELPYLLELKPYVTYLMGEYDSAKKLVQTHLKELEIKLGESTKGSKISSRVDIERIIAASPRMLSKNSLLKPFAEVYDSFGELYQQHAASQGDLYDQSFVLSQNGLAISWRLRVQQLMKDSQSVLQLGRELSQLEQIFYKDQLRKDEKHALEKSALRRNFIFSQKNEFKQQHITQKMIPQILEYESSLRKRYETLLVSKSSLPDNGSAVKTWESLFAKIRALKQMNDGLLMELRRDVVSPRIYAFGFQRYAQGLAVEDVILQKYRIHSKFFSTERLTKDFHQTWLNLQHALNLSQDHLAWLNNTIATEVAERREFLGKQSHALEHTYMKISREKAVFQKLLDAALTQHQLEVQTYLLEKKARLEKWLGDMELGSYKRSKQIYKKLAMENRFKKQLLKAHLDDFKQGMLKEWPN